MTNLPTIILTAVAALAISGCSSLSKDVAGPTVASFDHGATDTLVELGLEQKILAIPGTGVPDYLSDLAGSRADAGTLKVPDLDVIRDTAPDLALVTGRQSESHDDLAQITTVRDVSLVGGEFREALSLKVTGLATLYGVQGRASAALEELWAWVDGQRASIEGAPRVVVVTHNDGRFSLRDEAVVFQLLALDRPEVPADVKSMTRGARVFTPVTVRNLVTMAPDRLLVVDRSAAIGNEPLDVERLRQALDSAGGDAIAVTLLSPKLWYLSGAGLQSTRLQVLEVVEAL